MSKSNDTGAGCLVLLGLAGCFWLYNATCGRAGAAEAEARASSENAAAIASEQEAARKLKAEINSDPKRGPKPIPSEWDAITPEANAYLKSNLKDYESMKLAECSPIIKWKDDRWAQRVKYRAKNSFGAYDLAEQVFVIRDGAVTDVIDY